MILDARSLLARERLDRIIKIKGGGMSGGIAGAPKRESLAYRLDGMNNTTNAIASEIAKTANAIREALMGCPPPAIVSGDTERTAPLPGFLGGMIGKLEDNNRVLNYALDELRTVLGEIS